MLTIIIEPFSVFDEKTETFINVETKTVLKLEYSLKAITEWEKKYKKPWLQQSKPKNPYVKEPEGPTRTEEEMRYFIKCMVTNIEFDEIDDTIFYGLSEENARKIGDYLGDSQGVNIKVPEVKPRKGAKKDPFPLSSDRIYAWVFELEMTLEVENWNIFRLLTVIQMINYDNTPDDQKKNVSTTSKSTAEAYAKLNEQRLKQYGTKG